MWAVRIMFMNAYCVAACRSIATNARSLYITHKADTQEVSLLICFLYAVKSRRNMKESCQAFGQEHKWPTWPTILFPIPCPGTYQ